LGSIFYLRFKLKHFPANNSVREILVGYQKVLRNQTFHLWAHSRYISSLKIFQWVIRFGCQPLLGLQSHNSWLPLDIAAMLPEFVSCKLCSLYVQVEIHSDEEMWIWITVNHGQVFVVFYVAGFTLFNSPPEVSEEFYIGHKVTYRGS